jgi:hypothetical protein
VTVARRRDMFALAAKIAASSTVNPDDARALAAGIPQILDDLRNAETAALRAMAAAGVVSTSSKDSP